MKLCNGVGKFFPTFFLFFIFREVGVASSNASTNSVGSIAPSLGLLSHLLISNLTSESDKVVPATRFTAFCSSGPSITPSELRSNESNALFGVIPE